MKLFKIFVLGILFMGLYSCKEENSTFSFFEINNVSIYQYNMKDDYLSSYAKYKVFNSLDEIQLDNFTIIIENCKNANLPEELRNEIMNLFYTEHKIIFITGNTDEIRYKSLVTYYNWDITGTVGNGIFSIIPVSNQTGTEKDNNKLFYWDCLSSIQDQVYDYLIMQ